LGGLCSELHKEGGALAKKSAALFTEPMGWLEKQFRADGHEEDAQELSVHLFCAFQGLAAVAHAANDPDLVVMEVKRLKAALDKRRFGPWALVTGASSGIGKEFARQIAASGISLVLVARRDALLAELGHAISQEFDVQYRVLAMDLSQDGFMASLAEATHDIDIGLVVSNAGTGNPGEFLTLDRQLLQATLRLNTMAHLEITHHFGAKLAERHRGGFILVGAMGAEIVVPFMANDGGAKAYVHSLGEALHYEFKPQGVYVTVVQTAPTNTPVLAKFGFDPPTVPMKPMSVEQCVSEGLNALRENRSRIVPGRMNRIINALVPASVKRKMTAEIFRKMLANKPAPANARAQA
jgi:short-subunit dehydrogenase